MSTIKLTFDLTTNMPESNIECSVNIKKKVNDEISLAMYKCPIGESQEFIIEDIDTAEYEFKFTMSGKVDTDTSMDGVEILKTSEISIKNFKFDNFSIDHLMERLAIYTHDNNGYGEMHDEAFSYVLGCNGVVTFNFCTPMYRWLLANQNI